MTTGKNEAWTQALDLQKHFNDILFRVRGLAFAFGGAAAAYVGSRPPDAQRAMAADWRWCGLAAPWLALYLMDRLYYHELLRGAVGFARGLEDAHEAPPLCTMLTRENRATMPGRVKVSLFYWLPLAGFAYFALGGWRPWAVTLLPFVFIEAFALVAHRLRPTASPTA